MDIEHLQAVTHPVGIVLRDANSGQRLLFTIRILGNPTCRVPAFLDNAGVAGGIRF